MNLDFAASQKRLKERTKEATEKALQKAEKERIIKERQRQREAQREEEQRLRKLEQLRIEEEQRQVNEALITLNNGVFWKGRLQAVPAPEDVAASKGIKRSADKILLPPSAGASLLHQDAYKNGAYFFQLDHPSGRKTHAGILDFTAAEGFVALPRKVIRCLWGPNADTQTCCDGNINITYRKLPKATKAVFQPRSAHFQQSVGDDLREVLENALLQHSGLSVGDWIEVQHHGNVYDLRVRELEPESAVSVIDCEVEAEVHPSVETEERILEEELEAQRRLAEAKAEALAAAEAAKAQELAEEEEKAKRLAIMQQKAAALPEEPSLESNQPLLTCLFRFPDGSKHTWRFTFDQPIGLLFDFVDSKGASGYLPGEYNLVTQYPRVVFSSEDDSGVFIGQSALVGSPSESSQRQVLFLEPISSS